MKNAIKLTESFKSDVITIITSVYEACKNLTSASIKLYLLFMKQQKRKTEGN